MVLYSLLVYSPFLLSCVFPLLAIVSLDHCPNVGRKQNSTVGVLEPQNRFFHSDHTDRNQEMIRSYLVKILFMWLNIAPCSGK